MKKTTFEFESLCDNDTSKGEVINVYMYVIDCCITIKEFNNIFR